MNWRYLYGNVCVLALCMIAGCSRPSDPYDRVGFSGEVTLDGEPLPAGFLYLEPMEKQPTQASAIIQNGSFQVESHAGAVPGRYRVCIVRDDVSDLPDGVDPQTPEGAAIADKLSRAPTLKPLPEMYNVKSQLEANLESNAENSFAFHLKMNPSPPRRK
ncbi:hypothetical protein GC163_18040 [bacterium]|nr:hypothetical protein [bacterium]